MRSFLRRGKIRWLMLTLILGSMLACSFAQVATVTQIVEVTRQIQVSLVKVTQVVPVTQIVQGVLVVVTVPVEVPQMMEVTRLVPVTQVVPATPIVVTRIIQAPPIVVTQIVQAPPIVVTQVVEIPAAIEAPPPIRAPAPTAANNTTLPVWYDFEGDFLSSGVVVDRSGNGHDATLSGEVSVTEGISGGQAILFAGNGYIQELYNPVAGRSAFSFTLWFKTDHPEDNLKLASAAWWSGGPGSGWVLATHIPEFWSDDTRSLFLPDIINYENYFPAGEWIHEVVTYDGRRIREYTNTRLVNDWPTTGAAIGQGRPMVVGGWPEVGFSFVGAIDEFRVFDWALNTQEIQALYAEKR